MANYLRRVVSAEVPVWETQEGLHQLISAGVHNTLTGCPKFVKTKDFIEVGSCRLVDAGEGNFRISQKPLALGTPIEAKEHSVALEACILYATRFKKSLLKFSRGY